MYRDGRIYKIDIIKLAKERCKSTHGGNGNYKDYLWTNNTFEFEIFGKWSTFMFKGYECDCCEITVKGGYVLIPFDVVKEIK